MKKTLIVFSVLVSIALSGCRNTTPMQVPPLIQPVQTEIVEGMTDTPESVLSNPSSCVWNWASQSLPELSDAFTTALAAQNITDVDARASAYGENCFDPNTSQIIGFATKETDWYVTIYLASLEDKEQIGNQIKTVLEVIQSLQDDAPGPNPGYVGISFAVGEQKENLWFLLTEGTEALNQGLTGQGLYEELIK